MLIALTGCETESSDQASIQITPNTASMPVGSSLEFVASGWTDYTWSLVGTHANAGVISTKKGDSTVYTAVFELPTNQVQTLRVTVPVLSNDDGNTNNTDYIYSEVFITHGNNTGAIEPNAAVSISPLSDTVTTGGTVDFTASGGDGNYTWTDDGLGKIAPSGNTATYIANEYSSTNKPAIATITVTSDSQTASAIIVHE